MKAAAAAGQGPLAMRMNHCHHLCRYAAAGLLTFIVGCHPLGGNSLHTAAPVQAGRQLQANADRSAPPAIRQGVADRHPASDRPLAFLDLVATASHDEPIAENEESPKIALASHDAPAAAVPLTDISAMFVPARVASHEQALPPSKPVGKELQLAPPREESIEQPLVARRNHRPWPTRHRDELPANNSEVSWTRAPSAPENGNGAAPAIPSEEIPSPMVLEESIGAHASGYPMPAPRELAKAILPDYRVEPPDVLQIEAVHFAPKAPYQLRAFDSLVVSVPGALPDAPIDGIFPIEPGGTLNLGRPYGRVTVGGKTADEAREIIERAVGEHLNNPQTTVSLGEIGAKQQIAGPHLVGPDGAVTLGSYGKVRVVGKTVEEAKAAIESHLGRFLDKPELSVDVLSYNSKVFYVILQGAGLGDGVNRFPITGNDTVLDAISLINGLSPNSSTRIWVARPGFDACGRHQVLPIDWYAITQCADATTNYQLMPGDRVYVGEDRLIALDTLLGKVIAPAERLFGFVSLGTSTVSSLKFFSRGGQGGFGGAGGF